MNKQELKKYIIQQELLKVKKDKLNYTDYLCGNGRACDQVMDAGDESLLISGTEISNKLEIHVRVHEKNLNFIKQVNFKPSFIVELGAIIETNNIYLIIAASISPFEYDNKQFVGVSEAAPLYKCLEGKKVGDQCTYNDVKFIIKNIY